MFLIVGDFMCNKPNIRIVLDSSLEGVLPSKLFNFLRLFSKNGGFFVNKNNEYHLRIVAEFERLGLDNFIQRIPCGKCCGCRADWSTQWTARCMLESRKYSSNLFVTLTYNDDFIPFDLELCKKDYQDFFKRLRKWCASVDKPSPRYRICGEYGERNGRPHFHAIIFNLSFDDMWLWFWTDGRRKRPNRFKGSYPVYRSPTLEKLWSVRNKDGSYSPIGHTLIGAVNYASIKYVSNYQLKLSGQDHEIKPFAQSSTRPAIARDYFEENFYDIIHDYPLPEGLGLRVFHVKYFDKLLARDYPEVWVPIRDRRIAYLKAVDYDTTASLEQRLSAREDRLKRLFERKHRD